MLWARWDGIPRLAGRLRSRGAGESAGRTDGLRLIEAGAPDVIALAGEMAADRPTDRPRAALDCSSHGPIGKRCSRGGGRPVLSSVVRTTGLTCTAVTRSVEVAVSPSSDALLRHVRPTDASFRLYVYLPERYRLGRQINKYDLFVYSYERYRQKLEMHGNFSSLKLKLLHRSSPKFHTMWRH